MNHCAKSLRQKDDLIRRTPRAAHRLSKRAATEPLGEEKFAIRLLPFVALLVPFASIGMGVVPHAAIGADYPIKPMRIIVPYAPGGGTDTAARIIGARLTDKWSETVVIDNRPGAAGIIGSDIVAKSAPDGYTLLVAAGAHAINPSLYAKLPYDVHTDFAPVAFLGSAPNILVVNPTVGARSVKDLIALAKEKPGQLTFGSGGAGQTPHLAGELFKSMAHVDMTHVPYKGGAPATADLIGGRISLMFGGMVLTLPYVKAGKLRALATTGATRAKALPDLPTIAESGLPGYEANEWFGMWAPGGTGVDIVQKLNATVRDILRSHDTQNLFANLGAEVVDMDTKQFSAFEEAQIAKWAKVIKEANIHIQ
jgi:tripartite-type tricarboxylate transporter receptor subunit TctC